MKKEIEDVELVKMSPKGQLVVPREIRNLIGFKPGQRFIAFAIEDGVLFKKVEIPPVKLEFKTLTKRIEKKFKKRKVKKEDVDKAIKWSRR